MESSEALQETRHKKIPESVSGWQKWIETNLENFEGKITNAALLMQCFTEGINYIKEKTKTGLVNDFQYPDIEIKDDVDPKFSNIYCERDGRKIVIKKSFLEDSSKINPDETKTAEGKGEHVFYGTTKDIFRLTGVEEAHHASLNQNKIDRSIYKTSDNPVTQYNIDEKEYQALKWKITYAKEHNMPEETISILEKQRSNAADARRGLAK